MTFIFSKDKSIKYNKFLLYSRLINDFLNPYAIIINETYYQIEGVLKKKWREYYFSCSYKNWVGLINWIVKLFNEHI